MKGIACGDLTFNVYKGRNDDGPLFASYCSTSDTLIILTRSSNLYIKLVMTEGALPKGTIFGSWTTEDCKYHPVISKGFD